MPRLILKPITRFEVRYLPIKGSIDLSHLGNISFRYNYNNESTTNRRAINPRPINMGRKVVKLYAFPVVNSGQASVLLYNCEEFPNMDWRGCRDLCRSKGKRWEIVYGSIGESRGLCRCYSGIGMAPPQRSYEVCIPPGAKIVWIRK